MISNAGSAKRRSPEKAFRNLFTVTQNWYGFFFILFLHILISSFLDPVVICQLRNVTLPRIGRWWADVRIFWFIFSPKHSRYKYCLIGQLCHINGCKPLSPFPMKNFMTRFAEPLRTSMSCKYLRVSSYSTSSSFLCFSPRWQSISHFPFSTL
jgi:hypothetical protein